MSFVWEAKGYKSRAELLVMLAIADYSNQAGLAWPSVDSLAKKSLCTSRAVQKIVARLIKDKRLEVKVAGSPFGTNVYRIITGGVNWVQGEPTGTSQFRGGVNGAVPASSPYPSLSVIEPLGTKEKEVQEKERSVRSYPPEGIHWEPTEVQIRLGGLFGRPPDDPWSPGEIEQFHRVSANRTTDTDLSKLEARYREREYDGKPLHRRHTLRAFLEHYREELDKARAHQPHKYF